MPTQGLRAGAEGAGSSRRFRVCSCTRMGVCTLVCTSRLVLGLPVGPSRWRSPGQVPNASPRRLCPLPVAGAAVSLPQHLQKRLAEQSGSGSAAARPRRAAVAVGGPLLSRESPFSILPRRDHPSSIPPSQAWTALHPSSLQTPCSGPRLRLQHRTAASPSPPLTPQLPVACTQLSLGRLFFFISGSKLRGGRCSCSH